MLNPKPWNQLLTRVKGEKNTDDGWPDLSSEANVRVRLLRPDADALLRREAPELVVQLPDAVEEHLVRVQDDHLSKASG